MRPFLFLILLLLPAAARSQITLEEYRQNVVDYSYTLKKDVAAIDYAVEFYGAKRTGFLPSVTLSGEFSEQLRAMDNQEQWSFSLQPQISQTIYGGGSVRAAAQSAALGVDVAEADAFYDLLEVSYTADYYYYHLEAIGASQQAVDDYVEIISSLKEVVELRYREGYIAKGDLLMIETRLSEALYEQIAMNESYIIALQKFNILQGSAPQDTVELVEQSAEEIAPPRRVSFDQLLAQRPDFAASIFAEQQAQWAVVTARASYNPTVSVGVAGLWHPNTPNVNGSTVMDGSIFVKLSAPIFHFGERRRSVGAARALQSSSELTTLALVDAIRLEESNMWATIVDSYAQMEAARKALAIGGENLEISTFSYSEGLTTILDVMQAQISWLQLYTNSIWSEFNYLVALSAYRRITAEVE